MMKYVAFIKNVCTWINSSVTVSVKKTGNTSAGTTLSILKIYSRCLICILKYTEFTLQQFPLLNSLLACLPAIRPGSTMARAPVFQTIKVIMLDL